MLKDELLFTPANYFRELKKEQLFSDVSKPLEVDLGCGDGSFIEEMGALHPERNFLAVERLIGRVEGTVKRLRRRGLTNVHVLRLESAYTVAWLLPTASVSRVHLLCPDPWPKKKHHDRRMVNNQDFLRGLERILIPGGEFLLKTDDAEYFENALESMIQLSQPDGVTTKHGVFLREEWPEDAFPYASTGFEKHWLSMGRSIYRARWRKSAA